MMRVPGSAQELVGVDIHESVWYFLESYSAGGDDFLDIYKHDDPLIAGVDDSQYELISRVSSPGSFTAGQFLTRGPDGFYVDSVGVGGIRFYDVNGAFVEVQSSPNDLVGITYRSGSLVQITSVETIFLYGGLPDAAAVPGQIDDILVFPGDTEITYRIAAPDVG